MIEIVPVKIVGVAELKILREISFLSISQIKEASSQQSPIRSFEIFGGDWEEQREELKNVYRLYSSNKVAPFIVLDFEIDDREILTPEGLLGRFKFWRSIELEMQRNSDLENGYINSPDEFEAHDEDWT